MSGRKLLLKITNGIISLILRIICRIDNSELKKLPRKGPYIVAINHINFLEVPLIYLGLLPRPVFGLVKKETWDTPLFGFLARLWDAIPVNRNALDSSAFRIMQQRLEKKMIIIIAPEGTRSKTGILGKGHAGIITAAHRASVPIWPVVHFGGEKFWENIKKLKRTKIQFRVGAPLTPPLSEEMLGKKKRKTLLDELMVTMASLLPVSYRGDYRIAAEKKTFEDQTVQPRAKI